MNKKELLELVLSGLLNNININCTNCTNCYYCLMSSNLKDKKYVVKNIQLTEQEYYDFKRK